jgi:hypothetical protein
MTTRSLRNRTLALLTSVATVAALLAGATVAASPAGAAVAKAPSGSYTGQPQGYSRPVTFYVSADHKQIQDIAGPSMYLNCTGAGATYAPFTIPAIGLKANGSFSRTTSQSGVFGTYKATFTYMFRGNVGRAGHAAGTISEKLVYRDSATHVCTTGKEAWSGARDAQPAQSKARPPTGSYTGAPQGYSRAFTFYVSSDRKALQNIAGPSMYLNCTGAGATYAPFTIPAVKVAANGSFAGKWSQKGVFGTYAATYTYAISGHFHGAGASGAARAAGSIRENLVYSDSAKHTCTSNTEPWTGTRDVQPKQVATRPPAGSYSVQPQGYSRAITFSVSPARDHLLNVAGSSMYLNCTNAGATYTTLSIASIAITKGAFNAKRTESGVFGIYPATYTTVFTGHFHGAGADNAVRAAGTVQETMVYTDSSRHVCTSNTEPWAGERTGS